MNQDLVVWVSLAAAFAVTEVATVAFVAIYFALGAALAAVLAGFDIDVLWQVVAFIVGTVVLLVATRPLIKHKIEVEPTPTNVHLVVGKRGIVTLPIDNDAGTGQIRVGTEFWTARLEDGSATPQLPADARIEVVRVEGVTAYVRTAT